MYRISAQVGGDEKKAEILDIRRGVISADARRIILRKRKRRKLSGRRAAEV